MTTEERQMRTFSEAFKKEKVKEIEEKKLTVLEVSRVYEVTTTAVYKWIRKYGRLDRGERMVVEKESEKHRISKMLKQLEAREREIGRQQMEIRYLKEVVKHGSELLGEDLEKKVDRQF
jgi:transposase-like protein